MKHETEWEMFFVFCFVKEMLSKCLNLYLNWSWFKITHWRLTNKMKFRAAAGAALQMSSCCSSSWPSRKQNCRKYSLETLVIDFIAVRLKQLATFVDHILADRSQINQIIIGPVAHTHSLIDGLRAQRFILGRIQVGANIDFRQLG